MFIEEVTLLLVFAVIIIFIMHKKRLKENLPGDESQPHIDMALTLGQASERDNDPDPKPASNESLAKLEAQGIKLDRALTEKEADHLMGLFEPAGHRQLEILKHFKIPCPPEINKTQANYHIQTLFSNPANVDEWNQRPATSKVKQGILFMGGQPKPHMTQVEAQSMLVRYGMENPHRFLEWKHIERLFPAVNDTATLEHYNTRKITWKRFFQLYDALKRSGFAASDINADSIHWQAKRSDLVQKPRSDQDDCAA
ncbi:MAG: hypothetical protein B6D72_08000 [gamma proteobacterium symbiont of Ctena orbiculata]|nr:hypothetical protein [Candidatus Thiodiazotropha taylori]PUB86261.1 MAG: hypothetical protein DBP00_11640 [gamma proteobacterium symbiont of Ctena orbiculata]MBT3033954.1 hypothetical protein [Candidatus Thiodiazotropha taylori]MBV2135377.1 hypothetical protein [Candidatus Thiodiazotropha taylori]PVV12349.1 MAG: hypothetical protein B6D72_08000 [gamma proteobacterium symbiont of Ctena orbiculata]